MILRAVIEWEHSGECSILCKSINDRVEIFYQFAKFYYQILLWIRGRMNRPHLESSLPEIREGIICLKFYGREFSRTLASVFLYENGFRFRPILIQRGYLLYLDNWNDAVTSFGIQYLRIAAEFDCTKFIDCIECSIELQPTYATAAFQRAVRFSLQGVYSSSV